MKKTLFIFVLAIQTLLLSAQNESWHIVQNHIVTPFAKDVVAENPLPEYPRPQMIRSLWQNLNGLWNYKITAQNEEAIPTIFDGKILVPFAIESALSGVAKTVGKDSVLWYNTQLSLRKNFKNKKVLLHFGAVDWQCDVFLNGKKIGSHQGGYDPFSFDVTSY
jgi:beta-galactosidase/beta-glucuronidase